MVTKLTSKENEFNILALAKNCSLVPWLYEKNQQEKEKKLNKFKYGVKYGEKTIYEIFKDNVFKGKKDVNNPFATFVTKAENVYVPKTSYETIEIGNTKNAVVKKPMKSTMRLYVDNEDDYKRFQDLTDIDNKEKWIFFQKGILPGYEIEKEYYNETLFTATDTEKKENIITNIISYSLSKSTQLVSEFIKLIDSETEADEEKIQNIVCLREDKNVDLTLLLDNLMIVIENKIDSDISAESSKITKETIKMKTYDVFNKYDHSNISNPTKKQMKIWAIVEPKIKSMLEDCIGETYSQLTKYYIQSKIDNAIEDNKSLTIYYCLLVPNYRLNEKQFQIDENKKVQGSAYSNKYTLITYEELLEIFEHVDDYPYKEDILKEFKILASKVDNLSQNREIYKFLEKANYTNRYKQKEI
mgnify:FL=1|jgi:hypothetical protein